MLQWVVVMASTLVAADTLGIEDVAAKYKYCHGTGSFVPHSQKPVPCFSTYEKKYMRERGSELQAGLDLIRAPECFPHGVYIVAAGYYRSGSTLLFNTTRLWVALGAGEDMMAGWGCQNKADLGLNNGTDGKRPRTVVCKLHEMNPDIAKYADVVLMSHRNPYGSVCSRKMDKMWCKKLYNASKKRFITHKESNYDTERNRCMAGDEKAEVFGQCQTLMGMQADVYARVEAEGKMVDYDVSLEGWHRNPARHIKAIGRAIGICEAAVNNGALLKFLHSMGVYLGTKAGHSKDNGITGMHMVHSDNERNFMCVNIRAGIKASPECYDWYKHNGSSNHNGILKYIRECRKSQRDCGINCLRGHWYFNDKMHTLDYKSVPGLSKCSVA